MQTHEKTSLLISEKVALLMEDRRILTAELQQAIHRAETTGEKFINTSTGRSLAFFRPGRVTYWVEYSRVGEDFQIHSAYSHRMEMKRG